jgi:hypothetical protein
MGGGKVRIQLNRVSILFDGGGIVMCQVVAQSHPCTDHEIERIKFQAAPGFGKCLVVAALDGKIVSVPMVRICILRIQRSNRRDEAIARPVTVCMNRGVSASSSKT